MATPQANMPVANHHLWSAPEATDEGRTANSRTPALCVFEAERFASAVSSTRMRLKGSPSALAKVAVLAVVKVRLHAPSHTLFHAIRSSR